MALRLSTGLRQELLGSADFQAAMAVSFINIYSGSQPASADDDIGTSVLLATIYSDGASVGVSFDAPVAGVISKAAGETWSGTAVATGSAAWFRLYDSTDAAPESSDPTKSRLDGSVATSGGEMNISNTSVTSGAVQTVSTFAVTQPAS